MSSHLNALAESETEGKDGTSPVLNQAPLVNFSGHKDEGYAIDWSPATPGRLLSGISFVFRNFQQFTCFFEYSQCLFI